MTYDLKQAEITFTAALRNGDEFAAQQVISEAQSAGVDSTAIYLKIFAPSMVTIGELWEQNELSVAEEHLATSITERLIGQMSPSFSAQQAAGEPGRVVMGCVAGERHVLGLRMLADIFRKQGWRVLYLGADVPNHDWTRLVARFNADLVAISACAERHETQLTELIGDLRTANPLLEVLIGGGCFDRDQNLWRKVGATQHHPDALTAVTLATARYARDTARRNDSRALTPKI
ncbi:MAG: cobalamin-dependent protein [Chloroflexi bacterium]|nr:cobalamin-dependent protein [Chloroflexota bacterium]